MKTKFSVGVEEEFFLLDKKTNGLLVDPNKDMLTACEQSKILDIQHEMFTSQIELVSKVCYSFDELYETLRDSRLSLRKILADFDVDFVAASTFPTGICAEQKVASADRYKTLFNRFSGIATRLLCNGLHIHIGCENNKERILLLSRFPAFLPIFMALSSSSPFFEKQDTRLQSYRYFLLESLPLSGIAYDIDSEAKYDDLIDLFERVNFIDNESNIYWHLRLNARYPTVELRVCDAMPALDELIAVTALYLCLSVTLLEKDPSSLPFYTENALHSTYAQWQARRYSLADCHFIDFNKREPLPFVDVLAMTLEFISPVAKRFGCVAELDRLNHILHEGTSADRQRRIYQGSQDFDQVILQLVTQTHDY